MWALKEGSHPSLSFPSLDNLLFRSFSSLSPGLLSESGCGSLPMFSQRFQRSQQPCLDGPSPSMLVIRTVTGVTRFISGIVSRADSPKTLKFRLRNPTARYLGPSLRLSPGLPRLARVPRQATLLAKEDLDLGTHKIEELLGCMGLDWAENCSLAISTNFLEGEPQNE